MPAPRVSGAGTRGLSVFREFAPSPMVAAAVACTWEGRSGWARRLRVLPDGCADLVWDGGRLMLVGACPGPLRYPLVGDAHNVGLRLALGAAAAILGLPMSELTTTGPIALGALWGTQAIRIETELADAVDGAALRVLLERVVADRLKRDTQLDGVVLEAARLLGARSVGVAAVAARVGLSPRELRRRFHEHVGYGPKTLARVLRFQRVVRRIQDLGTGRISLAAIAADAGYADQAHLARECRQLSGSSPGGLVAAAR